MSGIAVVNFEHISHYILLFNIAEFTQNKCWLSLRNGSFGQQFFSVTLSVTAGFVKQAFYQPKCIV